MTGAKYGQPVRAVKEGRRDRTGSIPRDALAPLTIGGVKARFEDFGAAPV